MGEPGNKKKVDFEEESQPELEVDEAINLGRQLNKFQLLENQEADESSDDIGRIESDKSDVDSNLPKTSTSSTKSKSKNRRRNKNRRKAKNNRPENDLDNLEELLSATLQNQDAENKGDNRELAYWSSNCHLQLIKVDVRHLTPENELIRMFGKSVIKEERARETKSRHQLLASSGLTRSRFVSTGYLDSREVLITPGPKMELDDEFNSPSNKESAGNNKSEKKEINDKKPTYFRFVHEKSYQTAHNMFLDAAYRGYSDGIVENLNIFPTHVESLIQLSDMIRVSEDYKTASELIERALLIFERGFHPLFNFASASSSCRLTYLRNENRTFFVTIFKHIYYLSRRGLRRTPLEYTKLLLALDPDNDPLFATLLIDFYAIRSEEYDFLVEFITKWQHLSKLPNMNFSLALAHYMKSKSSKRGKAVSESNLKLANEYLQQALIRYPNFIITLLDACSAEPDPELLQTDYFNYSIYSKKYKLVPESVSLLMSIYVERNLILWNKKDVLAWLEKNTAILVKKFASGELTDSGQHLEYWSSFRGVIPRNLLRHIVLSELKVKVPLSASSSTNLDIDPFPPTNSISSYVRDNPSSTNLSNHPFTVGGLSSLFIRTILPSYGFGSGGGEESGSSGGNNSHS